MDEFERMLSRSIFDNGLIHSTSSISKVMSARPWLSIRAVLAGRDEKVRLFFVVVVDFAHSKICVCLLR